MLSINIGKPFLLRFASAKVRTFSELAKKKFSGKKKQAPNEACPGWRDVSRASPLDHLPFQDAVNDNDVALDMEYVDPFFVVRHHTSSSMVHSANGR